MEIVQATCEQSGRCKGVPPFLFRHNRISELMLIHHTRLRLPSVYWTGFEGRITARLPTQWLTFQLPGGLQKKKKRKQLMNRD